jgi:hypothetical protein
MGMLFNWFDASAAISLGEAMADRFMADMPLASLSRSEKSLARQQKVIDAIHAEIAKFNGQSKLNAYKKAKLADAFQNKLLGAGFEEDFVMALTKRIVMKMAYGKEQF